MKNICLLFILFSTLSYGQNEEIEKQAKTYLTELSKNLISAEEEYEKEYNKLEEIKKKLDQNSKNLEGLEKQIKATSDADKKIDTICNTAQTLIWFYKEKGVHKDSLKMYFPHTGTINFEIAPKPSNEQQKIFYYFGKDKVIGEDEPIFRNKIANDIFSDVLSKQSKTYLGDFVIPKDGQKLILYRKQNKKKRSKTKVKSKQGKKDDNSGTSENTEKKKVNKVVNFNTQIKVKQISVTKRDEPTSLVTETKKTLIKRTTLGDNYEDSEKRVYFKEVRVHILEGSVYDIQVLALDENDNILLFENKYPISLLRFTTLAVNNFLYFKGATTNKRTELLTFKDYETLRLRLTDVLFYIPNPGNNYLPENLVLEFPLSKDKAQTNLTTSVKYKIMQDTALENMVELRAYTDFLGLFADSDNGIVQLEGKADFYILPFNIPNSPIYFAKKISPFVNFSRLDEDSKYLELYPPEDPSEDNSFTIKNPLDVLEQSYLRMGVKFTFFSYRIKKEYPFDINLYLPVRYQIADLKLYDGTTHNYKLLGMGGGLLLEFRRYNNFGFNVGFEFVHNDMNAVNDIETIVNPPSFWTTRYDAEVYYFPGDTKKQSIFLRLKTYNDSSENSGGAFYQLQFGYRFSVGVGQVKG